MLPDSVSTGSSSLRPNSGPTLPHLVKLKDGIEVLIRKAEPEDSRMLYLMFKSLSVVTVFRRFLMPNLRLEAADMQKMLEDPSVTSLIATIRRDGKEQAVAEARYATDSTGRVAEAAVVVSDDLQNRGLGTALFSDLIAEARSQGLKTMFAYFDVDNKAIIRVGQKFGFKLAPMKGWPDYSMLKAELELER